MALIEGRRSLIQISCNWTAGGKIGIIMLACLFLCFKTRLYMIRKTNLISAVVAQPGRALDLLRGEAEDRAVVSSNLTDGIFYIFFVIVETSVDIFSIILSDAAR